MPKLAFSFNEINNYLNFHHRTFIQYLIEANTESYSEALGLASEYQSMRGRSDNMSKAVLSVILIPTKADDLS